MRVRRLLWLTSFVLVVGGGLSVTYGDVWREGIVQFVPSQWGEEKMGPIVRADQRFVVWGVSRNARALLHHPQRLFDAEQCYPAENSLALGEPLLSMGLLGTLPWALTGEPIFTYNAVLALMSVLAALAMFALVRDWTGQSSAGLVAAILYAFHPIALRDVIHPYSSDTTWVVFALFFGRRWFAKGQWRDALGLGASASLQMATSFYPFLASCVLALPVGLWLLWRFRLREIRLVQLAFVLAAIALTALLVFGPYVELRAAGELEERGRQTFQGLIAYLPGRKLFFGWLGSALLLLALLVPRRLSLAGIAGDPRWALLLGGLLVVGVAAGPRLARLGFPNLYDALALLVPGLDNVRIPLKIAIGAHPAQCILAGIGFAGLLRLWRWRGGWLVGLVCVALVFVEVVRPPFLGLTPAVVYESFDARPRQLDIQFYEQLEARGNRGPLFEIPIPKTPKGYFWPGTSPDILLSAYHHRRTSACYASYRQPHRSQLESISERLPSREAMEELRQFGFTTITLKYSMRGKNQRQEDAFRSAQQRGELRHILSLARRSAFALEPGDHE